jgi:hypothetical protein
MSVPVPDEATSVPVAPLRDVLGLPVLPPAWVAGLVLRLRASTTRVLRAGDPAPVRIFEGLQGVLDTAALVTLCRVGVPERLTETIDVEVLASDLGVDRVRLGRLVRYAAARGWVALDRHGRVRPRPVIRFLHADHPGGWRAWVEFMGGDRSRVVIVEGRTDPRARDEFAARTDLLMLALTAGGRERTATQFADLGSALGLRLERSVPLASGAVAHVLRRREVSGV